MVVEPRLLPLGRRRLFDPKQDRLLEGDGDADDLPVARRWPICHPGSRKAVHAARGQHSDRDARAARDELHLLAVHFHVQNRLIDDLIALGACLTAGEPKPGHDTRPFSIEQHVAPRLGDRRRAIVVRQVTELTEIIVAPAEDQSALLQGAGVPLPHRDPAGVH